MRSSVLQEHANADQASLTISSFLLNVGKGKHQVSSTSLISLLHCIAFDRDVKKIIGFVFSDLNNNYLNKIQQSERALLTTSNTNLEALNSIAGRLTSGEAKRFLSADKIDNAEIHKRQYPVKLLSSIPGMSSRPDHQIL